MQTVLGRPVVAKRNDETVRVDADVLRQARLVAASKDLSLAEYLSNALRPIVTSDYRELAESMAQEIRPPKPPKR